MYSWSGDTSNWRGRRKYDYEHASRILYGPS